MTKQKKKAATRTRAVRPSPINPIAEASPWWTCAQAGAYVKRGRRFMRREIMAGRLRGAIVGQRREVLTRREWIDDWVAARTIPLAVTTRRPA